MQARAVSRILGGGWREGRCMSEDKPYPENIRSLSQRLRGRIPSRNKTDFGLDGKQNGLVQLTLSLAIQEVSSERCKNHLSSICNSNSLV